MVAFDRMTQRQVAHTLVRVPATIFFSAQIPALNEVAHDLLSSPLGDPHRRRDIAKSDPRIARDRDEHVRVIGEEGPGAHTIDGTRSTKQANLYP